MATSFTSITDIIQDRLNENYTKVNHALVATAQGISPFVEQTIVQFQIQILNDIRLVKNLPPTTICQSCTTHNVLKCPTPGICKGRPCRYHDINNPLRKPKRCPNGICDEIRDKIIKDHRFTGPSWSNTDATKWCDINNPVEIAKCFMSKGYNLRKCITDMDLTGLLNVIINMKHFDNFVAENLGSTSNIFCQVRDIRNEIHHLSTLQVQDCDMRTFISKMNSLLSDSKTLVSDPSARHAIRELTKIETGRLKTSYEKDKFSLGEKFLNFFWGFVKLIREFFGYT